MWLGSHPGFRHVYNGAVHILFEDLHAHIPQYVNLADKRVKVKYEGQSDGLKCFNCQGTGHTQKECEQPIICKTCGKEGHKHYEFKCHLNSDFDQEVYSDEEQEQEAPQEAPEKPTTGAKPKTPSSSAELTPAQPEIPKSNPPGTPKSNTETEKSQIDEGSPAVAERSEADNPTSANVQPVNIQSETGDEAGLGASKPSSEPEKVQVVEKTPALSEISPIPTIPTSPKNNSHRSVMEMSLTYADMAKSPPKIQRKISVMTSKVKVPSAPKKSPGKAPLP